jgi:hypothetical protein
MTTRPTPSDAVYRFLGDLFGQPFARGELRFSLPGRPPQSFPFDAVSANQKVAAVVRAYRVGKDADLGETMQATLRLSQAPAERKFLFMTDPLFYQVFCQRYARTMLRLRQLGIEIVPPFELGAYLDPSHTEDDGVWPPRFKG